MPRPLQFRHATAAIVIAAAFIRSAGVAAAPEVRWETRIERAAAISRETGKPILVEFWATWCDACKAMDEHVYSDPDVAAAMEKLLPVRIDVDRAPSDARRYGVSATPTLVVMDAAGGELFRFTGSISRGPLLELMRELPTDISRINRLALTLAANKSDFATLDALARELRQNALYVASSHYYDRALQTDDAKRDPAVRARTLSSVGENYAALKRPDQAAAAFERALREARGLPEEAPIMLSLARAQIANGRTRDAQQTLDDVVRRFKGTAAAARAKQLIATMRGG
jgi:thioredoxin-like negative regulator of GroEL